MRIGMSFVFLGVLIISVLIVRSLYTIAVVRHREYSEMAANTHTVQHPVYAARGNIVDSEGKSLAISTYTYTIGVTPKVFGPPKNRSTEAERAKAEADFCALLGVDLKWFQEKMKANEKAAYMTVKKNIPAELNDKLSVLIKEQNIRGVARDANQARYYPQNELAGTLVGFANKQDQNLAGVIGVEAYYNKELAGETGYVYRQIDNYWAQSLPNTVQADIPAVPGVDVRMTIQSDLQRLAQDLAMKMNSAAEPLNGAEVIVLDAQTSKVLAMSSETSFNPNDPLGPPVGLPAGNWDPQHNKEQMDYLTGRVWTERALNYPHEVGSVVKPFVMAMGLDEAVINLNSELDDEPIVFPEWPHPISSYDGKSRGLLSPEESLWDSRNPPFVRISMMLGLDRFYDYVKALGFRDRTGIDMAGETKGLLHSEHTRLNMAVTSFGEQVTITGLRMATDYAMLANGGTLYKPQVVDALLRDGEPVKEFKPEAVRQVFSEESCREVRRMMIGVGRYGTGQHIYLPGLEAGYKTGTSSRALFDSETDNYSTHTAVCLLPAEEPKYVIYCIIHDSETELQKAAQISARIIGDYLAERDNMRRVYKAYDYNYFFRKVYPADVRGMSQAEARTEVYQQRLDAVLAENFNVNNAVQNQYPSPGLNTACNSMIWLTDEGGALPSGRVACPDFTGMKAEEALREAKRLKLNVCLIGRNRAGVCTSQKVEEPELAGGSEPGNMIREYSLLTLSFDGEGQEGPQADDSLVPGYNDGSGKRYSRGE